MMTKHLAAVKQNEFLCKQAGYTYLEERSSFALQSNLTMPSEVMDQTSRWVVKKASCPNEL